MMFKGFCSIGCILKLPIWGDVADEHCFDDEFYWEVRIEAVLNCTPFVFS